MAYIQQPTSKTLKKSNFSQNLTQLKTFLDSHYITRSYTEAVWKKKKKTKLSRKFSVECLLMNKG